MKKSSANFQEPDKFREVIRQKLEHHQAPPTDALWDRIELTLEKEEAAVYKNRFRWYARTAAACVLFLLCFIAYTTYKFNKGTSFLFGTTAQNKAENTGKTSNTSPAETQYHAANPASGQAAQASSLPEGHTVNTAPAALRHQETAGATTGSPASGAGKATLASAAVIPSGTNGVRKAAPETKQTTPETTTQLAARTSIAATAPTLAALNTKAGALPETETPNTKTAQLAAAASQEEAPTPEATTTAATDLLTDAENPTAAAGLTAAFLGTEASAENLPDAYAPLAHRQVLAQVHTDSAAPVFPEQIALLALQELPQQPDNEKKRNVKGGRWIIGGSYGVQQFETGLQLALKEGAYNYNGPQEPSRPVTSIVPISDGTRDTENDIEKSNQSGYPYKPYNPKLAKEKYQKAMQEYNNATQSVLSYTLELHAAYRVTNHWLIQSGMTYSSYRTETNTSYAIATFSPDDYEKPPHVMTTFDACLSEQYHPRYSEIMQKSTYSVRSQYHYIGVPLKLRYEATFGNWFGFGSAGFSFNRLLKASATTTDPAIRSASFHSDSPFREWQTAFLASAGAGYNITPAFHLELSANVQQFLQPLMQRKETNLYRSQLPRATGLAISAGYRFGNQKNK